ncbi:Peptidoglycan/LPS O-acetylase OafA/YrhL, contains acyltransferase and SGNH-hydrolase domains [Mycobacterium rhizamassiliense]|jgi:peptidoglycan/LPS O-acetylase OafA/YrhL|uniref:Peptidoglycan/LPS O-acetylase OafA/YrhL, contains acyltransferase and SGNH-hydrolase domains n=1 Tax=Mycobacterium rhizamassiliense TaxID=1841860 RepID=A0A2U3NMM1_9MYCO|nr:acyltransferase [Mycobacterium rhizamassiliense]SPM32788.1 Peptidoglycan/LPS O-acetylase OafA/YrhL, contains acyltransferase and SGNH-hydrolase domains [Mycobacterium rhizamassiliense]
MKLAQVFSPRKNALNAWRLALACEVILWHSFPLTGRNVPFPPAHQLLGEGGVDGFFAISGFLITSSWLRHPRLREYCAARALRILPGFWICLIVTAFVMAPIGVAIQNGGGGKLITSGASFQFVLRNIGVLILQPDIAGTPQGIPFPKYWNGSLWTLIWEVFCYILVAALGVVGLLKRRWLIPVLFALTVVWAAQLPPPAPETITAGQAASRFGMMFFAGALIYQFQEVIPARWSLVGLCAIIVGASSFMSDYRLFGALPLAYAVIVSAALLRHKRLTLHNDISYGVYIYAFPMQQLLVICGLASLNPFVFFPVSAAATLPPAALSWFLIEKHAMSLKARFFRKMETPPQQAAVATPPEDNRDASEVG